MKSDAVTQAKKSMLYILAGSIKQAERCARENRLKPYEWRYIWDYKALYGLRNINVWLCGEYNYRNDVAEVMDQLRAIGASYTYKDTQ